MPSMAKENNMNSDINDEWKLLKVEDKDTNQIWFFRKNMGIKELEEKGQYPTLVYFTVGYSPDDELGLPSKEDSQKLYAFEEKYVPKIENDAKCIHVASVMKNGINDHLFYISDPKLFLKTINGYSKYLEGFSIDLENQDDPEWEIYSDFPDGA